VLGEWSGWMFFEKAEVVWSILTLMKYDYLFIMMVSAIESIAKWEFDPGVFI
jgi:hypothetical protein